MKKVMIFSGLTGLFSGLLGAWIYVHFSNPATSILISEKTPTFRSAMHAPPLSSVSFSQASSKATPSVVFIKTVAHQAVQQKNPFQDFFFDFDIFGRRGPVHSSGSGVIVSADGYIVTNNHVIQGADDIEVIMNNNKKSWKAKVVGKDPNTDLALLKIDAKGLPAIGIGNSDEVIVGDWVLAVGNPFNLTSTVTAGIVSAKGRNINLVNTSFPIESFIQTDAAINPGNSGGALVDMNGLLIGINTAIASNTGSYNGYGFAIPVNMVNKIIADLKQYGEVQRGFPGIDVKDIDADMAQKINLSGNAGVYIENVLEGGPAETGGLKPGDIILKIENKVIDTKAMFDEQISLKRPGDVIKISYLRKGTPIETTVKLINKEGNTQLLKRNTYTSQILGAELTPLSAMEKEKYGVQDGFKVSGLQRGRLAQMGVSEGTIILKFNGKVYKTAQELEEAIQQAQGSISIEGMNANGGRFTYNFFSY